ncbi:MAG: beta-galactosidase [Armatimonadetes bacterium]|nr:beta-galactosidase [Armatimonadota bacterium]MDE2205112.1 beta-galactosidase [Armatimonadota bacterium]
MVRNCAAFVVTLAVVAAAVPAMAAIGGAPPGYWASPATGRHTFSIAGGSFLLDGHDFYFRSGEIHPSRIPRKYWRLRLRTMRAAGLNAVSVYIFWNEQEPEPGRFNFRGRADISRFLTIAQQEGLWVILRPGPYCCAEWEFGGYPYWLLNEPGLRLRSRDPRFLAFVRQYMLKLGSELHKNLVTHGGNVLLTAVENEYGSYGSDLGYMESLKSIFRDAGFNTPLFTCDGGGEMADGHIPGVLPGLNGGGGPDAKRLIDRFYPGGPYLFPEVYPGWLDHWGEAFNRSGAAGVARGADQMIANGFSFNYYMFCGGTNFGFDNGANYSDHYQPSITSYDYDAPMDESGRPTKKYMLLRQVLLAHLSPGEVVPPIPEMPPVISVPNIALSEQGSLLANAGPAIPSATPMSMEQLSQATGFVDYRTTVDGPLDAELRCGAVRDYAIVMLDGKTVGVMDRRLHQNSLPLSLHAGAVRLDILVENGGRINYGGRITDNHQGIVGGVTLNGKPLTGWLNYRLPLNRPNAFHFDGSTAIAPTLYKGEFGLESVGDTWLDMRTWHKGVAWINGHNLGRFWSIGPQQALYVPGVWLRKGQNTVIVLEESPTSRPRLRTVNHPIL